MVAEAGQREPHEEPPPVGSSPNGVQVMTRVPVADGVFTWPSDEPRLIGSRCVACSQVSTSDETEFDEIDRNGRGLAGNVAISPLRRLPAESPVEVPGP